MKNRILKKNYFIATTVDLLSTGVDIPSIRNVIFFRYLRSAITFYQMVGRGTRLDPETGKLMFRIYDYTNCTRLFGQDFFSKPTNPNEGGGGGGTGEPIVITTEELSVTVEQDGHLMLSSKDGKPFLITLDEYKLRVKDTLVHNMATVQSFRESWIVPDSRKSLIENLPSFGQSAVVLQKLEKMEEYDLYDVLVHLGYMHPAYKRADRVERVLDTAKNWLQSLKVPTQKVIQAILQQFVTGGTESLESPYLFKTSELQALGGISALKESGNPKEILQQTKLNLFSV